jgi:hypothetical protein
MPLIVSAAIGAGGGIIGSVLSGSASRDVAEINQADDTRQTSLEELFSESFLSSLSVGERNALEEQVSTGTLSSVSDLLSQEQSQAIETGATTGTESVTGIGTTTTTGGGEITRGSAASAEALQGIIQGGNQPSGGAAIQAAIDRVLRSGAPVVAGAGNRAGAFDSSVGGQLRNDLIIKAAEAGALVDLQQQNTNTQNLLAAVASSQAGQEVTATDQTAQQETQQATATDQASTTQSQQATQQQQQQAQQQQTQQQTTTQQQEQTQQQQDTAQTQQQTSAGDVFTDVSTDRGIDRTTPLGELAIANPDTGFSAASPQELAATRLANLPTRKQEEFGGITGTTNPPTQEQPDELTGIVAPDIIQQIIDAPSGQLI